VLCKGTPLRMRLAIDVRSVKCYIIALVGVIIKVILEFNLNSIQVYYS